MRRSIRWSIAAAAVLVAWSAEASAAGELPIEITIDRCIAEDQATVRKVLAVELGARPQLPPASAAIARVRIDCDGGAARITVEDPITGKTLVRRILLGDRPSAIRARVLGLAVAELLVASWVELQVNAEPAGAPVDAVAPERDREAVASLMLHALVPLDRRLTRRRFTVSAFAAARRFPGGASLVALGSDLEYRVRERIAIAVDLTGERGADDTQLGRIHTTVLSLAPRIDRVATFDRLEMALGAGVRGGIARLSSTPMDAQVTSHVFMRPWAGAFVSARLRALATDRWRLGIGIEAGLVAVGVAGRVEGRDEAQVAGPWIAAWAGGAIGL